MYFLAYHLLTDRPLNLAYLSCLLVLIGDIFKYYHFKVWCQVLHVLAHFSMVCNFAWMFCEGLYLHTLLQKAYQGQRVLIIICSIIGWGEYKNNQLTISRTFKSMTNWLCPFKSIILHLCCIQFSIYIFSSVSFFLKWQSVSTTNYLNILCTLLVSNQTVGFFCKNSQSNNVRQSVFNSISQMLIIISID